MTPTRRADSDPDFPSPIGASGRKPSSGILNDGAALAALQNLSATQAALSTPQNQVSSGLKVATASDSAAYRSIATTLKSDTGALSAVSDALASGMGALVDADVVVASTRLHAAQARRQLGAVTTARAKVTSNTSGQKT